MSEITVKNIQNRTEVQFPSWRSKKSSPVRLCLYSFQPNSSSQEHCEHVYWWIHWIVFIPWKKSAFHTSGLSLLHETLFIFNLTLRIPHFVSFPPTSVTVASPSHCWFLHLPRHTKSWLLQSSVLGYHILYALIYMLISYSLWLSIKLIHWQISNV